MYEAACRRWADRCFDEPKRLAGELSYDPAATVEASPGKLWIAARSGQLFLLDATRPVPQVDEIALRGKLDGAIVCAERGIRDGSLIVGTRYGAVHEVHERTITTLLRGQGRIAAVRTIRGPDSARLLVIDEARTLSLWTVGDTEARAVSKMRWDWFPIWVEPSREGTSLRMVAADGRSAEITVARDAIEVSETSVVDRDIRALAVVSASAREVVTASGGTTRASRSSSRSRASRRSTISPRS